MSKIALKLIAENKKSKDTFIDLANCGLKNYLPEELFDCVWLEELNLGGFSYKNEQTKKDSNYGEKNYFTGNELMILGRLTNLKSLYLSNNQIKNISFLEKTPKLHTIDLSENEITNYSFLEKLTQLHTLILNTNRITSIDFLKRMVNLKTLHLSSNKISDSDFYILEKLKMLETLNLNNNDIYDGILLENLTSLQSLNLNNNFISDIQFLGKLTKLKTLFLSNNQIHRTNTLKNLYKLQTLFIDNNEINDCSFLVKLPQLHTLNLGRNRITDYSPLTKLLHLKALYLSDSSITDCSFLETIPQLEILMLGNNQISNCLFLEKLPKLSFLDLRRNQIFDLELISSLLKKNFTIDWSDDFKISSNNIKLFHNPIQNPPLEIVKQGKDAIIEYFEGNRKPLNECKLIFVGDGAVGKTSLMKRIVFDEFDIAEKTTHGINKIAWEEIYNEKKEKIRVNLWDFGGQHIQHSLHQFFFTERVIYVLVLNPRNDQKANYWLDQIEKLGCNSEILITYNWKQEDDKQADFLSNFYELRKKYPRLPEPFLLSCQTGEGIDIFKKALITGVLKNEGLKSEYLIKWFNIKQRLEKEVSVGKNYITYDIYQNWCNEEKYTEPEKQKSLLKILDSIGSIVFFDKPILEQVQVLNPEWLTTGAYSILVSEQNRLNKGHLSWNDLKDIFKEEKEIFSDKSIRIKYSENQFQFIIELMLQYDLCQRNPFKQNEFLLPSAFGERPKKDYSHTKENARYYRLQFESPFEMLIIHRFIAKNLLKIIDKDYWHSGIYIKHPDSETYALVETNLYSKRIDCWIKGINIRGFWEVIRADFKEILNIYHKFSVQEEVLYEKDGNEYFLPYDEMLNSLRFGVKIIPYHPTYQLSNIDVLAVLDLFEDKKETIKIMENEKKGDIYNFNAPIGNIGSIGPDATTIVDKGNDSTEKRENDEKKEERSKEESKKKEDIAVKKWKNNALSIFIVSLILSGLGIYFYISESEIILSKDSWASMKDEVYGYDKVLKTLLALYWTLFAGKIFYDRILDDTKEKGFRENLKNKR